MKSVLIVEDQRMPRENMERMIQESGCYELAGSIGAAELAIAQCARRRIDLILMDVCTTGGKDGIEAAAEIKRIYPDTKIIIVTSMAEESYIKRAKEAKADSFWYKDISSESLLEVIDRTVAGERLFPHETPAVQLGNASSTELTNKEICVLRLVCEGMETGEIANELGLSIHTVKHHITSILSKTGYSNRTRLAIAVTKKNFIIPKLSEEESQ